jgi:thioredoxin
VNGKVVKVDDAGFDAVAGRQGVTLFDLWSPGCQPCRTMMPIIEDLAADFGDDVAFCKVDVEAASVVRDRLGARALPTLVLYRDGAEVDRLVGLRTRSQLTTWIEAHL